MALYRLTIAIGRVTAPRIPPNSTANSLSSSLCRAMSTRRGSSWGYSLCYFRFRGSFTRVVCDGCVCRTFGGEDNGEREVKAMKNARWRKDHGFLSDEDRRNDR